MVRKVFILKQNQEFRDKNHDLMPATIKDGKSKSLFEEGRLHSPQENAIGEIRVL
jgi:hypothetical protein